LRVAVFLDRDGTLIREVGYLSSLSQLEILPNVPNALKLLKSLGYLLIVVTNQSGVARGFFTESFVLQVHSVLQERFIEQGVKVDAFYYCPHHPTEGLPPYNIDCDCRKPKTGMLTKAALEHGIDIPRSWVIGDSLTDVQLAQNAGCKGIFLKTGRDLLPSPKCIVKSNLWEAAIYIASQSAMC